MVEGAAPSWGTPSRAPPPPGQVIGSGGADGRGGGKGSGSAGAWEEDVYVHEGILRCAQAILGDLERSGVLRAVLDGDDDARRRLGHRMYEQV